jgi:hypothetical protein
MDQVTCLYEIARPSAMLTVGRHAISPRRDDSSHASAQSIVIHMRLSNKKNGGSVTYS